MKNQTNQSTWVALGAAVVLLVWFQGVSPKLSQFKEVSLQAAAKEREAEGLEKRVSDVKLFDTQKKQDKKGYNELLVAMPLDAKAEDVFVMLEKMAQDSGVSIADIQISDENGENAASNTANFSLSVKGEFGKIVALSDAIRQNIRPIVVDNIALAARDSQGEEGAPSELAATFDLGFFVASKEVQ